MPVQTQTTTRNRLKQVVVLSSDPKGTEQIEWQPDGDPNGGDYQVVSETIVGLPAFTRLLSRGVIEVVEASEETKAAIDKQTAAFRSRLSGPSAKTEEVMDRAPENDFIMVPCIGPDARGTGHCGTEVHIREKTKDEHPALCSTHKHLEGQYVQSEVQEPGGPITKRWSRAVMTDRERQTQ